MKYIGNLIALLLWILLTLSPLYHIANNPRVVVHDDPAAISTTFPDWQEE